MLYTTFMIISVKNKVLTLVFFILIIIHSLRLDAGESKRGPITEIYTE